MSTMRTVAAFDSRVDAERTVGTLVDAGIDRSGIEVAAPVADPSADAEPLAADAVRLTVTAPNEDTELVEDILRDAGTIDFAASQTPALGWSGDPEGEELDRSRTPAIGWAGKVGRS